MRHPETGGEYVAQDADQAAHLRSSGWQDVDAAEPEPDGLDELTVVELRDIARVRELPVSGTRAELLERLRGPQEAEEEDQAEPIGAAEPSEEGEQ